MGKIIIAGAGHGGLVAGAILARNGHEVILYEKYNEFNLGHDWEDRFPVEILFDFIGEPVPWDALRKRSDSTFYSPDEKTPIVVKFIEENRPRMMWRSDILAKLIKNYLACGGKIVFGEEVFYPIISNGSVVGINTKSGNNYADLVIDALGIDSVLRKNLPEEFNIERDYSYGEAFYSYRAYYQNNSQVADKEAPFETYIAHLGEQGISWYDAEGENIDVLVGRIEPLSEEDIQRVLSSFAAKNGNSLSVLKSGGQQAKIPVRRSLAKFVAPGYAAVGDSAYMTVPMNGMGIELSIMAGMTLAKTILTQSDFSIKSLWKYNNEYIRERGSKLIATEILKNTLLNLSPREVDFLFSAKIISPKDLSGAGADTSVSVLIGKLIRGMRKPLTFFKVLKAVILGKKAQRYYSIIPKEYHEQKINEWILGTRKYMVPISKRINVNMVCK